MLSLAVPLWMQALNPSTNSLCALEVLARREGGDEGHEISRAAGARSIQALLPGLHQIQSTNGLRFGVGTFRIDFENCHT